MSSLPPVVVLAAGASTRTMKTAGVPKGLLGARPWLLRQLQQLSVAHITEAVLVLGFHKDLFLETIPQLAYHEPKIEGVVVRVVTNEDPDRGPFSSLLCGLRNVEKDAFMLPVDVPVARASVWRTLAQTEHDAVIPTFEERGGHPVLLRRRVIDQLLGVGEDGRLDHQLRAMNATRVDVEDPSILENHNEESDYSG